MKLYGSLLLFLSIVYGQKPCAPRSYGQSSIVCVCNQTYCDTLDDLRNISREEITVFESSKDGKRFQRTHVPPSFSNSDPEIRIAVNTAGNRQTIIGFGGAFTDAAGININMLPQSMGINVLKDYYTNTGLNYSMGRVPVGGADFSTRPYSYDDNVTDDFNLTHFALQPEDFRYKIPLIQSAIVMNPDVKLFASAWSSPTWMKDNGMFNGNGTLKGHPGDAFYKSFAQYYVKFLQAYEAEGINFWGLTTGNEPTNGFRPYFPFNCLAWDPEQQKQFVMQDLGPALAAAGYGTDRLKLILFDENTMHLPTWAAIVLSDGTASRYISGIGFHWYTRQAVPYSLLDGVVGSTGFLLATEACVEGDVSLGSWERAEEYATDILQDVRHWVGGWVDWNLALDVQGGPNWVQNWVDAPIIVMNGSQAEYVKQPMFYALAHFSKLLPPGSVALDNNPTPSEVLTYTFRRPDDGIVVILLNTLDSTRTVRIEGIPNPIDFAIGARTIQSYLFWI